MSRFLPTFVAEGIVQMFSAENGFIDSIFREPRRQRALVASLGQVSCGEDPADHDAENLPCRHCGAAV